MESEIFLFFLKTIFKFQNRCVYDIFSCLELKLYNYILKMDTGFVKNICVF